MSTFEISLPIDLSYLYDVSDDDREFVRDMIETIVRNTPTDVEQISKAADKEDWTEVGRRVHKLKPSLLLLNIESLTAHIRSFEENAKGKLNLDQAKVQMQELKDYSAVIVRELKATLESDSY